MADKNSNKSQSKHLVLVLTLMLLLTGSMVSASVETMKPAQLNEQYWVVQACATCTFVNVTITNKDQILFYNQQMTNNGSGNWIYSFTPTQVGRHDVSGVGDLDGTNTAYASYFEVTGSGFTDTLGFYFLVILLSAGVIVLGFYVRDAAITLLGTFGLYFLGLYILFNGIDLIKDAVYTWAVGIIILMLAAYISWKAVYEGYLS